MYWAFFGGALGIFFTYFTPCSEQPYGVTDPAVMPIRVIHRLGTFKNTAIKAATPQTRNTLQTHGDILYPTLVIFFLICEPPFDHFSPKCLIQFEKIT